MRRLHPSTIPTPHRYSHQQSRVRGAMKTLKHQGTVNHRRCMDTTPSSVHGGSYSSPRWCGTAHEYRLFSSTPRTKDISSDHSEENNYTHRYNNNNNNNNNNTNNNNSNTDDQTNKETKTQHNNKQQQQSNHSSPSSPDPSRFPSRVWWTLRYIGHEISWRVKDIIAEHRAHLPYPPGYEPPPHRRSSSREWWDIFLLYLDLSWRIPFNHPPRTEKGRQWLEASMGRGSGQGEEDTDSMFQSEKQAFQEIWSKGQQAGQSGSEQMIPAMQSVLDNRLGLVRHCLRMFIIGYKEGMGKNVEEDLKRIREEKKKDSAMAWDRDTFLQRVGMVAKSMRTTFNEMKEMTHIDDDMGTGTDRQPASRERIHQDQGRGSPSDRTASSKEHHQK